MHFAFIKHSLSWPRFSGHDVHCYHMMRALRSLGHEVALATVIEPTYEAIAGLGLRALTTLDAVPEETQSKGISLTWFQERFRSYWGIDRSRIAAVGRFVRQINADVVVAVGLEVLPYLAASRDRCRVWYAADEWVWHHLSLLKLRGGDSLGHLRAAVIKGFYERSYSNCMDRVWVVSETDRRAMRMITGVKAVDVVPNGVDTDYFHPLEVPEEVSTCVFWGRLDYDPNIQALEWFCRHVWPVLKSHVPEAVFRIAGFNPTASVLELGRQNGIEIHPNLPDLRQVVSRNAVAVLPFTSGGGIKNKLLEAASLGMACVCTPRACNGLRVGRIRPFVLADNPRAWADAILKLWGDDQIRIDLGVAAREWVVLNHTWESAAEDAVCGLWQSLERTETPVGDRVRVVAGCMQ